MKKEEIIKNPGKWSIIFSESHSGFSKDDYHEIKRVIIDKVIKPNKKDWEIKNILTCKGVYGDQIDTVLVNKSAKLEYDEAGVLIEDLGKIHYKKGFNDEEWKEIKEVLDSQQQENIPSLNNLSDLKEQAILEIVGELSKSPEISVEELKLEHHQWESTIKNKTTREKIESYKKQVLVAIRGVREAKVAQIEQNPFRGSKKL